MSQPDIIFTYGGKTYTVAHDAYNGGVIQLPDGQLLAVDGWLETYPPQPGDITVITPTELQDRRIFEATAVG